MRLRAFYVNIAFQDPILILPFSWTILLNWFSAYLINSCCSKEKLMMNWSPPVRASWICINLWLPNTRWLQGTNCYIEPLVVNGSDLVITVMGRYFSSLGTIMLSSYRFWLLHCWKFFFFLVQWYALMWRNLICIVV